MDSLTFADINALSLFMQQAPAETFSATLSVGLHSTFKFTLFHWCWVIITTFLWFLARDIIYSASEVTTIWRYTNVYIIIIIIYISRLCYDVSVRLSVTEVHWRI